MFARFLHNVNALVPLLMRAYTKRYCIPLGTNARATSKGGQFRRKQQTLKINWLP